MRYLIRRYLPYIVLILIIVICYFNSLSGQFVLDDTDIISTGKTLANWTYIFSHPLISGRDIILSLFFMLFGKSPIVFHIVNILFHMGTVFLLYSIVCLFSTPVAALFSSALFAAHPITSEAVSWISGGAYPQYSFFLLLSLLLFILSEKKKINYLLSIFFAICAFISSDKALVLPIIFLAYLIAFRKIKKRWTSILPFFGMSLVWLAYYAVQIPARAAQMRQAHYDTSTGQNPLTQIPLALTSYLQLIFFPANLSMYHTDFSNTWIVVIIRSVVMLLFIASIIYFYKRNRYIFFWLVFFIVSLGTTLTPFGISSTMTERYVYLGTAGMCAIVGYGCWRVSLFKTFNITVYLLVVFILMIFSIRTIVRNLDWQNEDSLWIATNKTAIYDPAPHINLGDVYRRRGDIVSAESEYKIALQLNPNYADAYNNLGVLYLYSNRNELAEDNYTKAIRLNPKLWQAYEGMGLVFAQRQQYEKTISYIQKAIAIEPEDSRLYSNLGVAYYKLHMKKRAQEAFLKSLALNPTNETAKKGLSALEKND